MESEYNEEIAAKTGGRQMSPMAQGSDGASSGNGSQNQRQMMTPPDMNCDDSDETCEVPEMPDGEAPEIPDEIQGNMGFRGRGEEFMGQDTNASGDVLHPAAYLGIGAGSVILGILVSYACFSKFFHARPGETFATAQKFIWFVVVALVIAAGICLLGYFIPTWIK